MLVPAEFVLFALTLAGVALSHRRSLEFSVAGLIAVSIYKVAASPFAEGAGVAGLGAHVAGEWLVLANLAGLLLGFAVLARHFEDSQLPHALPHYLPADWRGAFALLVIVFVLSSF